MKNLRENCSILPDQKTVIKIRTFVPSYFDKFRCIAEKCPDTCCVGWEVDIDHETAEKYSSFDGELGDKIKKHLTRDENGCNIFTLYDGDRCPFLNEKNLCEIHLSAGEKFLSKTCTLFPRFFDIFGSFREMGIGFGCPEGARIILAENEPFTLKEYEEAETENEIVDEDFLQELLDLRKELFAVLEDENSDFREKIKSVLSLARKFQKNLDGDDFIDENQNRSFDDCITVLENMEYISTDRQKFVKTLRKKRFSSDYENHGEDFVKLMKYYIFRYLLKAVYDYDVLTKVKYGVFACIVTGRIYSCCNKLTFEDRVRIMYSYSKEIEYSDLNMELLDEMMYSGFGTEDLEQLL